MKEKQIQIILILLTLVGAGVTYYLVVQSAKKRKRAIIEMSAVWGYYTVGSTNINDDETDHYSGLLYVDTLAKAFGTTRDEFYEMNPSLNPKITSIAYGTTVLVPQIRR